MVPCLVCVFLTKQTLPSVVNYSGIIAIILFKICYPVLINWWGVRKILMWMERVHHHSLYSSPKIPISTAAPILRRHHKWLLSYHVLNYLINPPLENNACLCFPFQLSQTACSNLSPQYWISVTVFLEFFSKTSYFFLRREVRVKEITTNWGILLRTHLGSKPNMRQRREAEPWLFRMSLQFT